MRGRTRNVKEPRNVKERRVPNQLEKNNLVDIPASPLL